ncbi:MAG TPA: alpha-D-ribose 1-methylphosphonate 5-phosphate C-P-lyase PhnJ [Candidatus Dormibacteraeota bacterium]|nr:alpha-D-ribose 1-methylphosphonate 5-phosphate C-P-lyase PhnJ [Candidatus Dormibacteraeota bacterium]
MSAALDGLLAGGAAGRRGYNHAYLDEAAKREVRRTLLKALCLPGHQIPFASREMPVARGWGSGGLQITLATVVPEDTVKVIDQGDDESLNALGIRDLVTRTTGAAATTETPAATLIQTRHRIPEDGLAEGVVLVFQVPIADPLRIVDARPSVTRRMHAEGDYAGVWLYLYEDMVHHDHASFTHSHPVEVEGGYVMSPSPIPRHDVARLDGAPHISLFGAGREATLYAVPPYTRVRPLAFEDRPFETERFGGPCVRCGSTGSFLVESGGEDGAPPRLVCSDTDWCRRRRERAR